jgi:predicted DNA-binding transcriptional regulator AlpA
LQVGPNRVCWFEADIDAYLDRLDTESKQKVARRDQQVA